MSEWKDYDEEIKRLQELVSSDQQEDRGYEKVLKDNQDDHSHIEL